MIEEVQLKNFKCFDSVSIALGQITLLSGLNGMGKSTVLQALLLLRQSYQQGLLSRDKLSLNGDLVNLGNAKDILFEGAKDDIIGIDTAFGPSQRFGWWHKYENPQANVLDALTTPETAGIGEQNLFNDNFHYLRAERLGPRTTFATSEYDVVQHGQLGSRGEYATHFLSVNERTPIPNANVAHPKAASSNLLDQVQAWLGDLCPGVRLDFKTHDEIDLVSLRFAFLYGPLTSNPYRATNVGFGLTYTLPVLIAALSLPPGGLLLVENAEAHLHPQGQVRMGELLSFAASGGVQVILETHSDHLLNGVRLAVKSGRILPEAVALRYFDRAKPGIELSSKVQSMRVDRNGRIDAWPAGFFDEWDKSLEELLKP